MTNLFGKSSGLNRLRRLVPIVLSITLTDSWLKFMLILALYVSMNFLISSLLIL